jgi:leucyl/phenylalanyl-tRNA--protein transferase
MTSVSEGEGAASWLKRQALVLAFALKPSRLPEMAQLWPATLYAYLRPGPRIPEAASMLDWPDGYGGPVRDRSPDAMCAGMRNGFHMLSHWGPWKWWSPRRRAVVMLDEAHVEKRLAAKIRKAQFRVTMDTAFDDVVRACAAPRGQLGLTWLTPDVRTMFSGIFRLGRAHSVEVWDADNNLVGGMFGVVTGPVFSSLSLFHTADNASKLAIVSLYHHLSAWGMAAVDHQRMNPWAAEQGARLMPRAEFLKLIAHPGPLCAQPGKWKAEFSAEQSAAWKPSVTP